ncbi:YchJ family protein [Nitrosomonas sp. Nm84]|uniref:YchJ family protein n=1 Tax=Nitrosomonas sp. Nm84 TaxID=200124 RepID=UPI000D754EB8|nr:YchJ family metal-binding protein [Nitrosomonas sp. Nm84]
MAGIRMTHCPCSNTHYINCCGRYLDHGETAATAEILMRSRYTAYTLNREDYLLATWHSSTRPISLELARQPPSQWLGLTVKRHERLSADRAIVEFVARYKINGRAYRLHEISRFIQEHELWFYADGDIMQR